MQGKTYVKLALFLLYQCLCVSEHMLLAHSVLLLPITLPSHVYKVMNKP